MDEALLGSLLGEIQTSSQCWNHNLESMRQYPIKLFPLPLCNLFSIRKDHLKWQMYSIIEVLNVVCDNHVPYELPTLGVKWDCPQRFPFSSYVYQIWDHYHRITPPPKTETNDIQTWDMEDSTMIWVVHYCICLIFFPTPIYQLF